MGIIIKQFWLFFFLSMWSIAAYSASPKSEESRTILVINSYEQGFTWTDSLMTGILREIKAHPETILYIENLNSKRFGQNHFETFKSYFQEKYASIHFDGILVTDNDALDFAFQYDQDLFPNTPVVFAGISNPEEYVLNDSQYYGFKETASIDQVLHLVQTVLPEVKRLLVLTDLTTTGQIYRKEFTRQAAQMDNFSVVFPEVIDIDAIYRMVESNNDFDAIYYIGINQDKNGNLVDFIRFLNKICQLAKVPVFNNDPLFNGKGVIGGLYQSGKKHGGSAAGLLVQLMDTTLARPAKRYGTTGYDYYFDYNILNKFNVPSGRIPDNALVINRPSILNKKYFFALISALALLILIVLLLSYAFRKTKTAEKKINKQLKKIQHQNQQLEDAQRQLNIAVSELGNANKRLKETNINLLDAKKKAEESDNLKSAFLANVSHEIRTPLNSIVGFSSLLSEPGLDEETRETYAGLIESNTESLLVLIDEIIDLSKIETQQLALKMQEFSIDSLIDEMFLEFNHSNKNQQLDLHTNKISAVMELFVFSDRTRVKQIFINLLTNALKFTESGFIEFGYFLSEKQEIVLFVKDTGIGIKKEHHEAIFHRFRKLNENSAKIYRGTGLGLAITQKLVELLGGEIWIDSEPGRGSVFYFTLKDLILKERTA